MSELEQILAALFDARQRAVASTLVTVVAVEGSTYRRPGARMLITDDGLTIGTISGGCLEKELQKKAAWMTREGRAAVVRFDTTSEDEVVWEFGLGCRGVVYVLLERVMPTSDFAFFDAIASAIRERRALLVETIIESDDPARPIGTRRWGVGAANEAPLQRSSSESLGPGVPVECSDLCRSLALGVRITDARRVFRELIVPPVHLLICGAGHDAVPVSEMAAALGWRVTVCDSRAAYASPARFPTADRVLVGKPALLAQSASIDERTVAVVMSHNFYDDRVYARELIASHVAYIGLLGPRSRTDELLKSLRDDGVCICAGDDRRIFAPVGLDVGAETPQEIAVAIVAEIQGVLAGHGGGSLRDRVGPIHAAALASVAPPNDAIRASRACPI